MSEDVDTSDWAVPPMPDRIVIAELRMEVERLRFALSRLRSYVNGAGDAIICDALRPAAAQKDKP